MRKPQNTKKWQIDENNNREDDMKGREMEYMSDKEFSKNLGEWIREGSKPSRAKKNKKYKKRMVNNMNYSIYIRQRTEN